MEGGQAHGGYSGGGFGRHGGAGCVASFFNSFYCALRPSILEKGEVMGGGEAWRVVGCFLFF